MAEYWLLKDLGPLLVAVYAVFVYSALGYNIYLLLGFICTKDTEKLPEHLMEQGHDTGVSSGDLSYQTHSQGTLFTILDEVGR